MIKISQSHLAVMNGKIVMKTVSGHIALMISGQAFRTVIRIWQRDVKAKYDIELESVGAFGVSAMMHGYMPFNKEGELLVPFRTWRNNITGEASEKLMELFNYNIPQRWSIICTRQFLTVKKHVKDIDYITTLRKHVH